MFRHWVPGFPWRFTFFSHFLFLALAAGVPLPAAAPGTPPPQACSAASTGEFLNTRLSFWQQRLELGDWKLSVVSSHPSDLKPETLGNIHWDKDTKTAVVRVLAPSDYKMACPAALQDMELTVVHELIHLTLSPLRSPSTNLGDEEHTVVKLADALLKSQHAGSR
jgi:hypothetical protein